MMRKLIVVTGGTRGIGKAIVSGVLKKGYRVYFTFKNSWAAAKDIEIDFPGQAKGFQVDSASNTEIVAFIEEVLSKETPYALVNNVGVPNDELFYNQSFDTFLATFQINFGSAICYVKGFLSAMMIERCGHIINMSSIASRKPKAGNAAYGSAKAAIERFSSSLAIEVARFNINVNCVSPGFVKTEMFEEFLKRQDERSFYKKIPMRKILSPEEVANVVALLIQGEISTTGTNICLGNGENIY